MTTPRLPVYTIGHSNRPIDEFVALLEANRIQVLVDIRKMPRSRHNPQFEGDALAQSLKAVGIEYLHEPLLGGLRRPKPDSRNDGWKNTSFRGFADYMGTDEFKNGLDALLNRSARATTAIMCAEAVPWRCHRTLVADALKASRRRVLHIIGGGTPSPHKYTPFLRRRRGELIYPASAVSAG